MLSPDDIAGRDFRVARRGYDRDEVHAFLSGVAAHVAELEQRLAEAERAAAEVAAAPEPTAAPAPEPAPAADGTSRAFAEIGHETQRILEAAREAARGISRQAETDAAEEVAQARRRAEEVVAEAERRREAVELVIAQLEQSRAEIAADLRGTQRTIEQTLRDLLPRRPGATMREALSDEARRQTPSRAEPAEGPSAEGGQRATSGERDAGAGAHVAQGPPANGPSASSGGSSAEDASRAAPSGTADESSASDASSAAGPPVSAPSAGTSSTGGQSTGDPSTGGPSTGPSPANGSTPGADPADADPTGEPGPTEPSPTAATSAGTAPPGPTATGPGVSAAPTGATGRPVRDDDDTDPGPPPLAHAIGPDAPRVRLVTSPSSPPRPYGRPPDPPPPAPRDKAAAAAPSTPDPLALRATALGSLHRRTVRRLKRGLGELETTTLDRVRRVAGQGEATALLPLEEDVEAFVGPAADQLEGAYQAGVESAAALAGRPLPAPEGGRDLHVALRSDAGRRVGNSLLASLRAGIDSGEDVDALVDRARAVFGDLRRGTADELAGAHLVHAYELGLLDAWAHGGVEARSWVLGEELRCPESRCRHNDRVGPLPVGEPFPSGHDVPPIHVGCTCTTVPATAVPARPEPPA